MGRPSKAAVAKREQEEAEFLAQREEDAAERRFVLKGGHIWCRHCERVWEADRIGTDCECGAYWFGDSANYREILFYNQSLPERPPHGFRCTEWGEALPPLPEG